MKNLQKLFSMTMLVCMAVAMFSCSKDEEELGVEAGIVGKWEISSIENLVNGQSPDRFVTQMAQQLGISVEEFEEEYGDFDGFDEEVSEIFQFNEDQTYVEIINDNKGEGTWSAGVDRTLEVKYENAAGYETYVYDVKTLKSDRASLSLSGTDKERIGDSEMDINFEFIVHLKR